MKLLITVMLASCLGVAQAGEVLDFEFVDANGHQYRTATLADDLARYNWPSDEITPIKILLIETPSLKDARYKKQSSILTSLGHHDNLGLFYVVACPNEEFAFGYHTSKLVAKTLAGSMTVFRIRLLDQRGGVLHESLEPISADALRKWNR